LTVTPNSFVTTQTPFGAGVQFLSTDAQNAYKTLYAAGANGSRVDGLLAVSNDPGAHNVTYRVYSGASLLLTVTVNAPATAGDLNPSQPLLGAAITPGLPVDQYGNQYLFLPPGATLQVAYNGALTGGDGLYIWAQGADY
jgi:hypothetical protein